MDFSCNDWFRTLIDMKIAGMDYIMTKMTHGICFNGELTVSSRCNHPLQKSSSRQRNQPSTFLGLIQVVLAWYSVLQNKYVDFALSVFQSEIKWHRFLSLLVMQVISLAVASTKCLGENLAHSKMLHSRCLRWYPVSIFAFVVLWIWKLLHFNNWILCVWYLWNM